MNFLRKRQLRLVQRIDELASNVDHLISQRDLLLTENSELKAENKSLAQKRKMEDEMIAHKLKMREETVDIKFQQKAQEIQRDADEMIASVKNEYRDKLEAQLEGRGNELREMYSEILARLPDINVQLSGGVKPKTATRKR